MDLILNEQLDEQNFEAEEMSFAQELLTMPAFSTDKEDEDRLKTYILQRVPPMLKSELDAYLLYRTETSSLFLKLKVLEMVVLLDSWTRSTQVHLTGRPLRPVTEPRKHL